MSLEFTGGHRRTQTEESTSVPLAPLIDMIFILLIFFLVTSTFSRESGLNVTKPEATTGSPITEDHPMVTIRADETISIDDTPVEPAALVSRIERRMRDTGSRKVVIAADRAVRTELLVRVIDQCKKAGAEQISIATRNPS